MSRKQETQEIQFIAARALDDHEVPSKIHWEGEIHAVQCRSWIWRYRVDNRTHYLLGFNLWIKGEAADQPGNFIVAVSDTQHRKMQFCIGDVVKGTAWPCGKAKHEIADYYRVGRFKFISRHHTQSQCTTPPFANLAPPIEVYGARGARMLDQMQWRKACMTCMWANKSAVEIEYRFGKTKRYRKETFCYGPKSCSFYEMGEPRPVQYFGDEFPCLDDGGLDDSCTGHRGEDE